MKLSSFLLHILLLTCLLSSSMLVRAAQPVLQLTAEEKQWLSVHPVIRARVANVPPYHFWQDGPQGISVELLDTILGKLGIQAEYQYGMNWTDALKNIRNHEKVDLLLTAKKTPEREAFMAFSQNYLKVPWVIFTRDNEFTISSLNDLFGKTIAIEKGFALQLRLAKEFPQISQLLVADTVDALLAVKDNRADAYVGNLTIAKYHIAHLEISGIKMSAPTDLGYHTNAFAVRGDWPQLASILDKGLAMITPEEMSVINNNYFTFKIENQAVNRLLGWLLLSFVLLVTLVLIWNYQLRRKVSEKTGELLHHKAQLENEVEARTADLRQSQQQLSLALEGANLGMWDWRPQSDELFTNDIFLTMLGYEADAFPQTTERWSSLVHPDDLPLVMKTLQPFIDGKEGFYRSEHRLRTVDDQWCWIEDIGRVMSRDANGKAQRLVGVHIDINERKLGEERFALARQVIEQSVNEIYMFDKETLKFIDVNMGARRNLGYSMKELVEMTPVDIKPEMTLALFAIKIEPLLSGTQVELVFNTLHERKDGSRYPVEVHLQLIQESPALFVAIILDITERKQSEAKTERLQRELQQKHKMEVLGQMTGGVAHDFNNILGIVMGFTSMAIERYGNEVPEKMTDYLKTALKASERARNLVLQMLTFSHSNIEGAKLLQFAPLLKENIQMLHSILPSSIRIELNCEENIPYILMDPVKLQQLMMNLCTNARDAMDSVGTLKIDLGWHREIDSECVACHHLVEGDWIELSISDTGSGIKQKDLTHLFEPFFTTKDVGYGTGMGLSVLHGIVMSHGGHILVETELDKGSTFRLLFPPVDAKNIEAVEMSSFSGELPQGEGRYILVLDDEPELAKYIGDLFNLNGYQAIINTDSQKVLSLFQQNPDKYALLVTDQTMPGLTGIELIKSLREIRSDFPVILCTGYSDTVDRDDAERIGISYMNKPVDADMLILLAGEVLNPTEK